MNKKPSIKSDTGDARLSASEKRLERRSSLLTCCPKSDLQSPTLNISPFVTLKSLFPIRDSRKALVAIGQRHARDKAFTLFCRRPLSPGQKPSLTMGARILYKLGLVTMTNQNSGKVELWNGRTVSFQRDEAASTVELQRLGYHPSSAGKTYGALTDGVLLICTRHILDLSSSV